MNACLIIGPPIANGLPRVPLGFVHVSRYFPRLIVSKVVALKRIIVKNYKVNE